MPLARPSAQKGHLVTPRASVLVGAMATLVGGPVIAATVMDPAATESSAAPALHLVVATSGRDDASPALPPPTFSYDDGRGPVVFATALVPEPADWVMLVGGLGCIGAIARRRRRVDFKS